MRLSPPGRSLSCPRGDEGCEYICESQHLFPTKIHSFILTLFCCLVVFFFSPGHIISFSKTTETLPPTLTCHSSSVMCWRPFGAAYLQRKSVFPVLLEDFHHSSSIWEKKNQALNKPMCRSLGKLDCTERTRHKLYLTLPSPQNSNPFQF